MLEDGHVSQRPWMSGGYCTRGDPPGGGKGGGVVAAVDGVGDVDGQGQNCRRQSVLLKDKCLLFPLVARTCC